MLRKKVLIVDFDNTLAGVSRYAKGKIPAGMLLPKIIDRVKEEKYDDCYGFTARRTGNILSLIKTQIDDYDFLKSQSIKKATLADYSDIDPCDLLTIRIVENFSKLTGLTMSKVSTPDDLGYKCGSGYEKNIQVIEKMLLKNRTFVEEERVFVNIGGTDSCWEGYLPPDYATLPPFEKAKKEKKYANWTVFPAKINCKIEQPPVDPKKIDSNSKNNQLLSVVRDLVETYPDVGMIELDVIEDKQEIIDNLFRIDIEKENWPVKVLVKVYHYDAFEDTEITLCGCISRKPAPASVKENTQDDASHPANPNLFFGKRKRGDDKRVPASPLAPAGFSAEVGPDSNSP